MERGDEGDEVLNGLGVVRLVLVWVFEECIAGCWFYALVLGFGYMGRSLFGGVFVTDAEIERISSWIFLAPRMCKKVGAQSPAQTSESPKHKVSSEDPHPILA